MDYEEYEKQCKIIQKENEKYLDLFEQELEQQGLSTKTINRHLENVDFYINEYMLYEEPRSMDEGVYMIDMFLGYYFIRKCMWSTPASIKSTAASIKKFYKCMLDHGKIEKEDYDSLCSEIKERMSYWQADCAQFNDPDAPSPFAIF